LRPRVSWFLRFTVHNDVAMLWVNLGLIGLIVAVAIVLISIRTPQLLPAGRILAPLALQISGVLVVTWFLVTRGQAQSASLPPPPGVETGIWSGVAGPAVASLELVLVSVVLGTSIGTAAAALVAWSRSSSLELLMGVGSLIWIIPTFLVAILAQDLQATIFGLTGARVSGSYGTASVGQLLWCAAVLSIRPAAYSFRQSSLLISDQARANHVRTAFAKGLPWKMIVARHIIRPTAAGLVQTAASSIRLMFGALPLVEFFFAYPGLGQLLLSSLGVNSGIQIQIPGPSLAIASAVLLACMLAVLEALARGFSARLDPRFAEAAT
jgi:ABC-type dipeptide/oligopeptide/nickel transport system permease component